MTHDPSFLDAIAAYFHTSEAAVILWGLAGVIVIIWAVGRACVEVSANKEHP